MIVIQETTVPQEGPEVPCSEEGGRGRVGGGGCLMSGAGARTGAGVQCIVGNGQMGPAASSRTDRHV